jgi:drug/metabolite transporter (DMT)-like permease
VSKRALGTLLVSISAAAFGTYSYFAILAGEAGIRPVPLLFFRFAIATFVLGMIAVFARGELPRGKKVLSFVVMGLLYTGQSFTYLQCLLNSNPVTASLLLYLYPAFVTIGSVMFLHERLTPRKTLALVSAFAGSIVIMAATGSSSITGTVANPGLAIGYGIATAICYAAYLVFGKHALEGAEPMGSTVVIFLTTTVAFGIASMLVGLDTPASVRGWIGVGGLAIVATVVAIGCLIAGLKWTTPVEAASLSAIEPLVSAVIAVTLMGLDLTLWHVFGGLLVIVAVIVLARQPAQPDPAL